MFAFPSLLLEVPAMYDMKSFFKKKKNPSSSSIVPSQQVLKQKEMEERVGKG